MQFTDIIDANNGRPSFRPIMQKEIFPISESLSEYLKKYGRDIELPILYNDLINYSYSDALKDKAENLGLPITNPDGTVDFTKAIEVTGLS